MRRRKRIALTAGSLWAWLGFRAVTWLGSLNGLCVCVCLWGMGVGAGLTAGSAAGWFHLFFVVVVGEPAAD